jgi:hypothetical protein
MYGDVCYQCVFVAIWNQFETKIFDLDTYHPDNLYVREEGTENQWLYCEAKMGPLAEILW